MSTITLAQITDAINTTLGTASILVQSQSYDELTENIPDTPLLQVYPQEWEQSAGSRTDRITMGGGGDPKRHTSILLHVDYYAQTRSNMGEDMARIVEGVDQLFAIFEAQDKKPYFGLEGIKAFRWRGTRVEFLYGGISYAGARFYLNLEVY